MVAMLAMYRITGPACSMQGRSAIERTRDADAELAGRPVWLKGILGELRALVELLGDGIGGHSVREFGVVG